MSSSKILLILPSSLFARFIRRWSNGPSLNEQIPILAVERAAIYAYSSLLAARNFGGNYGLLNSESNRVQ